MKRIVHRISHLLHENGAVLHFEEFETKHGLSDDFLTYNSGVRAAKKYIKSLETDVQSHKSSNLRKSLTVIYKVHKATKTYYSILVEN